MKQHHWDTLNERLRRIESALSSDFLPIAIEEAVERLLKSKRERNCRRSYLNTLSSNVGIFSRAFAGRTMHSIAAADIERWLNNPAWNCETRRGYLKNVRTLFSFAHKRQWIAKNPAMMVDWPMPSSGAPGILSVDDSVRLMRAAFQIDAGLCPWLAVQLFGGLRVCEACALVQDEIRDMGIIITAAKCKTRRRRIVPLNGPLKSWLAVAEFDSVNWRKRLKAVRDHAGIPWPRNCLRHSFVSYAMPVHGASTTAQWAGHSESVLFSNYRELVTVEDSRKFWSITPRFNNQLELPL